MVPTWLTALAWISFAVVLVCAGVLLHDIFVRGHRQRDGAMDFIWPITALYFGPLAVWAYNRWGRVHSPRWQTAHRTPSQSSRGAAIAVAVTPCGAASTIGHAIGVWVTIWLGLTLFGMRLWPMILVIATIALPLLLAFEYRRKLNRGISAGQAFVPALIASTLAILAFDVGMGGTMIVLQLVLFPAGNLAATEPAFWLFMQIGMIFGFVTGYPAVSWLVQRGIKETV